MPKKWTKARVFSIEDLSSTVRQIKIGIEDEEIFEFLPGQFLTFDLPIGEKRLDRWRSYSIANAPNGSNEVHLIISHLEGGRASEFFFNELEQGQILKFKGPAGQFVLPAELEHPIVMICTGTGVAPFKSMMDYIFKTEKEFEHIHLIFGTRHLEGVLYKEEFDKYSEERPNFRYDIALSRESYKGYRGYVHKIYKKEYGTVNADIKFYLCGWQNMIDQACEELLEIGYRAEQIIYELYG